MTTDKNIEDAGAALNRLSDTLRGFYSECRSEIMDCDKEDIATIRKALQNACARDKGE